MNLMKLIRNEVAADASITIIRADQFGKLPSLPYATYKIIGDRKGKGRENISHKDQPNELQESRTQERNATISFNVYGTSHDDAYEVASQLRRWFEGRWFEGRGSFFLDSLEVAVANVSDVQNRTTFLIDSYDEKWGFDVIIRYNETDEYEIDYFDKVEYELTVERE
ncbi:phage neck terminator protein [Lysinibacillus sp. NPDC047702]|uniref:phage neck terminator protein n=1 Tax=unclassified Lysinibacillus TaxID=2636778 RepID=UPI003D00C65D